MKQLQQAAIDEESDENFIERIKEYDPVIRIILLSEMITITDVGHWKLTEWVRLL